MSDPASLSTPTHLLPLYRAPHALRCAAVLGAGAWGTALASALQRAGVATTLWARRADCVSRLSTTHRCDALPGIDLPQTLQASTDLTAAVRNAQVVILAVPASATRDLARQLKGTLAAGTLVLSASKGFEHGSGAFMTQVLDEALSGGMLTGALTGPSFAIEVARGEPTLLTLAMTALSPVHPHHHQAQTRADLLTQALSRVAIRVETTPDVIGAQVGGALKNQIAIACGMAMALGMGENARAGILTRGLDDMRRLVLALGGCPETLLGSCGVGDLFLTAASRQSRNTRLGMRLAGGQSHADTEQQELTEGAHSARAVSLLEHKFGVRVALAETVRDVLDGTRSPAQALANLLEPTHHTQPRPVVQAIPLTAPAALPALLRPLERLHRTAPIAPSRELRHA